MSTGPWIVLRLEVAPDAEPISGTLTEGDGPDHSFTGWLGLTEAIEAIRAARGRNFRVHPDANSGAVGKAGERSRRPNRGGT